MLMRLLENRVAGNTELARKSFPPWRLHRRPPGGFSVGCCHQRKSEGLHLAGSAHSDTARRARHQIVLAWVTAPSTRWKKWDKSFQVTRERIRQIEAKALRKLRHPSRSRKLRAFIEGVREQ